MDYSTSNDRIYCYPNTNVLRNKFNIQDPVILEQYEKYTVAASLAELASKPLKKPNFTAEHLKKIHKYIFKELYTWAGEFRKVNISKEIPFAQCEYIPDELNRIFKQLNKEDCLKGLEFDKFCERLAYYKAEINMIHPFREGNGRSTRELIRQIAEYNGYVLSFARRDPEEYMAAMKESAYSEPTKLKNLLKKLIIESTGDMIKDTYRTKYPNIDKVSNEFLMDLHLSGKNIDELKLNYKTYLKESATGNGRAKELVLNLHTIFSETKPTSTSLQNIKSKSFER